MMRARGSVLMPSPGTRGVLPRLDLRNPSGRGLPAAATHVTEAQQRQGDAGQGHRPRLGDRLIPAMPISPLSVETCPTPPKSSTRPGFASSPSTIR